MQIPFIDLKTQYKTHQTSIDTAINNVLSHGKYIMGPEVNELEKRLREYIGVEFALSCSSGTDALLLPMMAKSIGPGDAVFTTPFTFFASAESISLCGATPVFVDIDPDTYNLSPTSLEKAVREVLREGKLTPKAVMPVDLFGLAADFNAINIIAKENNLFVLEDAAQSFGAPYHNKKACSLGDAASTSFYPAKPLGCYGDGGAVFTNDQELYETMVSLRVHGQAINGNKYDNVRIGLNARMDTIQAAILLEKLKFYDHEIALRNSVADLYSQGLRETVKIPHVPENQGSVWAQYSIQVNNREKLKTDLENQQIPMAIFYPTPIHLSSAYKHLKHAVGDFPVSEEVAKKIVSLPMHPYLEPDTIKIITDAVLKSQS